MSGLIWIQTVWHSNDIPERIFGKVDFEINQQMKKTHEKLPSRQRVKKKIGNSFASMYELCWNFSERMKHFFLKNKIIWNYTTRLPPLKQAYSHSVLETCMFFPTRADDAKSHKRSTTQPFRSGSKSAQGSVMSPLKASKVSSVLANNHANTGSVKRSTRHSGTTPSAKR